MITLVLDCIDRLNVYNTAAHFSEFAGEEAAESWKEIVNLLYELLGLWVLCFQPRCGMRSWFWICCITRFSCFSVCVKPHWSEEIVLTVPCSVTTSTGWSVNWTDWRHRQVGPAAQFGLFFVQKQTFIPLTGSGMINVERLLQET